MKKLQQTTSPMMPFELAEKEETQAKQVDFSFELEQISPQKAEEYLAVNFKNRPLSMNNYKRLAEYMRRGQWRATMANPITFDWNGVLQDGQHRLRAVVESGCTVSMYVIRGANPADFDIIDTGKSRTPADVLALAGIAAYSNIASVIGAYNLLRNKKIATGRASATRGEGSTYLSNRDILKECQDDYDFWHEIANFGYRAAKNIPSLAGRFIGGSCAYLIKELGYDRSFVKAFYEGLWGASTNPTLYLLRDRLTRDFDKGKARSSKSALVQKMVIKAWNAYAKGKELKQLYVKDGEKVEFE